jgi:hypothetical protein
MKRVNVRKYVFMATRIFVNSELLLTVIKSLHTGGPGVKFIIRGGHSIDHSKQKVYMYMCPIPNSFRDRAISLYSSNIVDEKELLRTVSNTIFTVQVTKLVHFT